MFFGSLLPESRTTSVFPSAAETASRESKTQPHSFRVRVALYLRRSTNEELQADSLEIQERILRLEAERQDHQVVPHRIFSESKSGREAEGRSEFLRLIEIVTSGQADFDAILVRDVSRWGRFENADEAAYYDFLCFRHGVEVIYVEEAFGRETSGFSALMRTMKRVQAAEFSRDKSRIVSAGKRRGAERGYRVGAPPPYGMKRVLVQPDGTWLQDLPPRVHKLVSAVKTRLAPANDSTTEVVAHIFELFSKRGFTYSDIVRSLNDAKIPAPEGGLWYVATVHYLLSNPSYIGTARYHAGGAEQAILFPHAHEGFVDEALFAAAQQRIASLRRSAQQTRRQQLAAARDALARWGHLSADLLCSRHLTRVATDDMQRATSSLNDACSSVVADEKSNITQVLQPRFRVDDLGDHLLVEQTVKVSVAIGVARIDLEGEPFAFSFRDSVSDLYVAVGINDDLKPSLRCVALGRNVNGKHLLRRREWPSRLLPTFTSERTLLAAVVRLLQRTAAAESLLLELARARPQVTYSGLSRELRWSPTAVKRVYLALRKRGEPLPELLHEQRSRFTVQCSSCGVSRELVRSDADARKSDLCGRCSRRRGSGKLLAVCSACGAERMVWPSTAKKMLNGLASLCHACSLAKGRALTLERNLTGADARQRKLGLLRDIALLVVRLMATRPAEFLRPTLWSTIRRQRPTIHWKSPNLDRSAHRLIFDCDAAFVERCLNAPHAAPTKTLAAEVLDRTRWIGGDKNARGERVWLVRLT